MKKRVLATSWHPGGVNAIVPVIKKIIDDDKLDVLVLGHGYSIPMLENAEISYKTINELNIDDVSVDSMDTVIKSNSIELILTAHTLSF